MSVQKVPFYKAKSLKGYEVVGAYTFAPDYTSYPIGDQGNNRIRHYIVTTIPGDWGLPYSFKIEEIDVETLELKEEKNLEDIKHIFDKD